jgi:hypothetical protein
MFLIKNSEKIIKNINIPSCRNCIYYKPAVYNNFDCETNKCEKFGEKNIVTNEISYDFANSCRNDELKCGKEGKYFQQEENVESKIIKHYFNKNLPFLFIFTLPFTIIIVKIASFFY